MNPLNLFRLLQINFVLMRYSVVDSLFSAHSTSIKILSKFNPWHWKKDKLPRGDALCKSLETLGPIFVKFGQVLSTRHDLFPSDIVTSLAKLQDNVDPFPSDEVIKILEQQYKKPILEVFQSFDR